MDDATQERINQLRLDIIDAIDEVGNALDSDEDARQLAAGRQVEALARRYRELLDATTGADRDEVSRVLERKLTDLRRTAAQLTRRMSGTATARSADAGIVPFLERRAPPKSIEPQRQAPTRDRPRYNVGGDVEAWCGKCGELRTHDIVAIVDGTPKQVICQTCRSKHGFRTEPARARGATPASVPANNTDTAPRKSGPSTPADREAQRRRELQQALIKELEAAESPRPFNPKERYKAGEIIVHAEHGRGKIENVLRGSLLVRFREGLRPLNLA